VKLLEEIHQNLRLVSKLLRPLLIFNGVTNFAYHPWLCCFFGRGVYPPPPSWCRQIPSILPLPLSSIPPRPFPFSPFPVLPYFLPLPSPFPYVGWVICPLKTRPWRDVKPCSVSIPLPSRPLLLRREIWGALKLPAGPSLARPRKSFSF